MTKSLFSFFSGEMSEESKAALTQARQFFKEFSSPIVILGADKKILYANQRALDLLGYPEEEAEGLSYSKLALKKDTLKPGNVFSQKITTKEGKKVFAKISVSPLSGTKFLILTVEAHQTQAQLTRTSMFDMFDESPFSICMRDKEGNVLLWNNTAALKTDIMAGDIVGKKLSAIIKDKAVLKVFDDADAALLKKGRAMYMENFKIPTNMGDKYFNIFKSFKNTDDGDSLFLDVFEEVTQKYKEDVKNKQVQEFLETIIATIPMALYARDEHGRYLFTNKKSREYFGGEEMPPFTERISSLYDREVGKEAWREFNPKHETLSQVKQYLNREQKIFASGETLDVEQEDYVREDGSKKVVHLIKAPVYSGKNNVIAVLTVAEDVTEKIKKDREVLEAKNFLDAVFSYAPLSMYARDLDGNMVFSNKKTKEIFIDKNLSVKNMSAEDELAFITAREAKIVKERKTMEVAEEIYVTPDGAEEYVMHLIKAPVLDDKGQPFLVLTIAQDITDKRNSEREVINAKNFLQNVVDNLPVALLAKKYNGQYILWNKKSEELFGAKADEVVGKEFYQTNLNKDLKDYILQQDKMVFDSKREIDIPQELVSTMKSGVKIMHTVKTPIYKEDGTPDYLLSVSEDITQKSKMEKQLMQSREKYSLMVENSNEGVVILEGKKIIFANAKMANLLGYETPEQIMNVNIVDYAVKEHKMFLEELWDGAVSESSPKPADIKMLKADGEEIADLEASAVLSKYMGKKIVLMFFRDVTLQNSLIKDLRTDVEKFRNSFENNPSALAVMSSTGYPMLLNAAAREIFNLKKEDQKVYRTYYVKPLLPLGVRKRLKRGERADSHFTFDPAKLNEAVFTSDLKEKMEFTLRMAPINRRDTRDGSVASDYIVLIERYVKEDPAFNVIDAMWLNDPAVKCLNDGTIDSVNPAFDTLGLPGSMYQKGKMFSNLFVPADRHMLARDLEELFRNRHIYGRFYKLNTDNPLSVVISAARTSDDSGFIVIFKNETPAEQTAGILRERQEIANSLMASIGGAAFFCKLEGNMAGPILHANKESEGIFSYKMHDFADMSLERLFTAPANENVEKAQRLIDAHIKQLSSVPRVVFTAKAYKQTGEEMQVEVAFNKFDLNDSSMVLCVVRDLNALVKMAAADSKDHIELSSLKKFFKGILLKADADGVVQEGYTNSKDSGGIYNFTRYQYKSPYDAWPKDVADTLVYSIKEALGINITTSFTFSLSNEDGVKSYEAFISPILEEQQVFLLLEEIANTNEMERKIQALYEVTSENGDTFTKRVDEVLELGKKMFNADAGFILRYAGGGSDNFTIVYASENDLNIRRSMVFPDDQCFAGIKNGSIIMLSDVDRSSCEPGSLCKSKEIKVLIAGPLYLGGKVAGGLCFVSRDRIKFGEGDQELIALMSRLLSASIEVRQAGKILDEGTKRLEDTFKYLSLPAVIFDPNGDIKYINGAFLSTFHRPEEEEYLGKNFFDLFTPAPHMARKAFFTAYNSEKGTFTWDQSVMLTESKTINCVWKVDIIKTAQDELKGFALVGSVDK
ncbi:PAS domain S-box-containing protein [Elusimicrobium simillimum]|uniref:PAS domain S-box protein n=1 Tax=Elusimicrobium simillimum TaxID=3143438 RepID=UPI003C6FD31F